MQWSQTLAGVLRTGDGTIARQGFVYVIIYVYIYIYISFYRNLLSCKKEEGFH